MDVYAIETRVVGHSRLVLNHNQPLSDQVIIPGVIYVVSSDFDLEGKELRLPINSILEFDGGRLFNGVVSGNKMPSNDVYSPEQFGAGITGDDTEAIQSCLNVCRNIVMNESYFVSNKNCDKHNSILSVMSNTSICLNGTISLLPVDSPEYSILSIKNSHSVNIYGRGSIVGDKDKTKVTKGEHGMGISITGASSSITLNGLSISNCFGDAIYIGTEVQSKNYLEPSFIKIKNCELYQCRRQGVSIVIGHHIQINKCKIHNINGTAPGSAIDIEPQYIGHPVHDVTISESQFNDCVMALYCGGSGIQSRDISITNCSSNSGLIEWRLGDNTTISNCNFQSSLYTDRITLRDSYVGRLFYKGSNEVISKRPDILAKNCNFQVLGYVNPTGYVKLKGCVIDYPIEAPLLNGSPLRGAFLELIDCTCTGLGTNYRYAPDILHLKAKRSCFHYNKSVCIQGDVLELNRCIIKGENIEQDNTFIYARKKGSKIRKCNIIYLNESQEHPVWVIRAGEERGIDIKSAKVVSNSILLQVKNIDEKAIVYKEN